jgi:hypothetical protein
MEEDSEEYLRNYSDSLGGFVEELSTRFYSPDHRMIVLKGLAQYIQKLEEYSKSYSKYGGYDKTTLREIRFLKNRLEDCIIDIKENRKDRKLVKILEDFYNTIDKIYNELVTKTGEPEYSDRERQYVARFYRNHPYKAEVKSNQSLSEDTKDAILASCRNPIDYVDNVISFKDWIGVLEELSEFSKELKSKNDLKEKLRESWSKQEHPLQLQLDKEEPQSNLDKIRKGRLRMKED